MRHSLANRNKVFAFGRRLVRGLEITGVATIHDADVDPAAVILLDRDGHVMVVDEQAVVGLGHLIRRNDGVVGNRGVGPEETIERRQVGGGSHGGRITRWFGWMKTESYGRD